VDLVMRLEEKERGRERERMRRLAGRDGIDISCTTSMHNGLL
jgi:hypothetical protein